LFAGFASNGVFFQSSTRLRLWSLHVEAIHRQIAVPRKRLVKARIGQRGMEKAKEKKQRTKQKVRQQNFRQI
jgi:hypothetical protein